jgi:hypothetical protein
MRSNRPRSLVEPHCVQVAVPREVPTELPYFRLLPKSQQRAKPQLDRFPLCLQPGGPKYVVHQLVVNHDVGAHGMYK